MALYGIGWTWRRSGFEAWELYKNGQSLSSRAQHHFEDCIEIEIFSPSLTLLANGT